MMRESPLKNVAKVPLSSLKRAEKITGVAPVKDFNPIGKASDGSEKVSWTRIAEAVLIRDDYRCRICSKSDIVSTNTETSKIHMSVEVHHIIPRSRNGADVFENLITLCESCHHITFSNSYSGLPLKNSINLDNFQASRNVALPFSFLFQGIENGKTVYLKDYVRGERTMDGWIFSEVEGSEVEASLFEVQESSYFKLVKYLEDEFQVNDYRTLMFRYGNKLTPARVFESSQCLFL